MPLPALATTGPRNGGDPIAAAYLCFAMRLFLFYKLAALRGNVGDRVYLMSPDGAAFMDAIGLDPCATQARLLAEWARAGMRGLLKSKS